MKAHPVPSYSESSIPLSPLRPTRTGRAAHPLVPRRGPRRWLRAAAGPPQEPLRGPTGGAGERLPRPHVLCPLQGAHGPQYRRRGPAAGPKAIQAQASGAFLAESNLLPPEPTPTPTGSPGVCVCPAVLACIQRVHQDSVAISTRPGNLELRVL
jgi:hypothetical protein